MYTQLILQAIVGAFVLYVYKIAYREPFENDSIFNVDMILLNIFLFLFLKGILAENKQKGVHLWRAQGDFNDKVLDKFYERANYGEDIWIRDNRTIDFLLYSAEQDKMTTFLKEHGLNHSVLIKDVRRKLDDVLVKKFPTKRSNDAVTGDTFTWTAYPSLHEINKYFKKMVAKYPTHCKIRIIGKTSRATPIYIFKISNGNATNRPILMDSGIYGREWQAVISMLYFIDTVVQNFDEQPSYVTRRDWHIVPVVNPDGYDYSRTKDSTWKKNRRKMSGGKCYGIDVNRNFDFNWGQDRTTHHMCRSNYCGPVAFSEGESQAIMLLTRGIHFGSYISILSTGGKVLYPYGSFPEYKKIHKVFSNEIAKAMRKVDNGSFINRDTEYLEKKRFGMALEWMHFEQEILHTYIIQTRPPSSNLPSSKILIAAQEVFAGLMKFARMGK